MLTQGRISELRVVQGKQVFEIKEGGRDLNKSRAKVNVSQSCINNGEKDRRRNLHTEREKVSFTESIGNMFYHHDTHAGRGREEKV